MPAGLVLSPVAFDRVVSVCFSKSSAAPSPLLDQLDFGRAKASSARRCSFCYRGHWQPIGWMTALPLAVPELAALSSTSPLSFPARCRPQPGGWMRLTALATPVRAQLDSTLLSSFAD